MRIRPGIFIVLAVAFLVLFGGRQLGWFGGKPGELTSTGESQTAPDAPSAGTADQPQTVPPSGVKPGQIRPAQLKPPAVAVPQVPTAPASALITDWEEKIDNVLTAQEEDAQKVKRLLDMFPHLPEDGQVEAAQHLSNLTPDEQYAALAKNLTNAAMPEAVLDVLMTDVLNRPNQIKLETLLEVARAAGHPKAEEARDVLEVFVDENFGENWAAWEAAIKQWLKENPDE